MSALKDLGDVRKKFDEPFGDAKRSISELNKTNKLLKEAIYKPIENFSLNPNASLDAKLGLLVKSSEQSAELSERLSKLIETTNEATLNMLDSLENLNKAQEELVLLNQSLKDNAKNDTKLAKTSITLAKYTLLVACASLFIALLQYWPIIKSILQSIRLWLSLL